MKNEKMIEELARIQKDPRVKEALGSLKSLNNNDILVSRLVEIAAEYGYELKEADILQALQAAEARRKADTEAAAAQVERLTDDEVAKAAGGGQKANCKDTYMDRENCWITDGCDQVSEIYPDYKCHNNSAGEQCNEINALRCNEFMVGCENTTFTCWNEYYRPGCGYSAVNG